jgi:hypothetical protein
MTHAKVHGPNLTLKKRLGKYGGNLTRSLTCGTIVKIPVKWKGRPNPFSQDALREERTSWLKNFSAKTRKP